MPHTLAKIVLPVFAAFAFFTYPVHFALAAASIEAWQPNFASTTPANASTGYVIPSKNVYDVLQNPSFALGSVQVMLSQSYASSISVCLYITVNGAATSTGSCQSLAYGSNQLKNFSFYPSFLGTATITPKLGDVLAFNMTSGAPATFQMHGLEVSSTTFTPYAVIYGFGDAEVPFITTLNNRRGVPANCGITDISGCIVNAISWAFVWDDTLVDEFHAISFASTSPFGYVPAIRDLYSGFASTSSTTVISANLHSFSSMFPTTSIPILSASGIQSTIGMTWWNFIQNILGAGAWLLFIAWVWKLGTGLFS